MHHDPVAARAAESVGARAFALGDHIFFADGHYRPGSDSGRRLIAHELTHVVQSRSARHAGPAAGQIIMREAWAERAGKWYDEKKWDVYRAMISALRTFKNTSFNVARRQVPRLPAWMQGPVGTLLDSAEFVADLCIALALAIIGLAVGFVEGIVGMVVGLIQLVYKLLQAIYDLIKAIAGDPEAFEADIDALAAAVKAIPAGLKQTVEKWIDRYKKASAEEQVLMGAELVGQIEAVIASFALGAAKSGQVAEAAEAGRVSDVTQTVVKTETAAQAAPTVAKTETVAQTAQTIAKGDTAAQTTQTVVKTETAAKTAEADVTQAVETGEKLGGGKAVQIPKGPEVFQDLAEELGTTPAKPAKPWTLPGTWKSVKPKAFKLIFGKETLPDINRVGKIRMTLGHIVEKSTGGAHSLENLMPQLNEVNVKLSGIYARKPFAMPMPNGAWERIVSINGKPVVGSLREAFEAGTFSIEEQRAVSYWITGSVITPQLEAELAALIKKIPDLADLVP